MSEKIHHYDLSSTSNPKNSADTFTAAKALSGTLPDSHPVGVLLYPFVRSLALPLRVASELYGYNPLPVDTKRVIQSTAETGIQVTGVHGEFFWDKPDLKVQATAEKDWFVRARDTYVWPKVLGFAASHHALEVAQELAESQARQFKRDGVTPYIGYHMNIFEKMDERMAVRLEKSGLPVYVETAGYIPGELHDSEIALQIAGRFKNSGIVFAADHNATTDGVDAFSANDDFAKEIRVVHIDPKHLEEIDQAVTPRAHLLRSAYEPLANGGVRTDTRFVLENRRVGFGNLPMTEQVAAHLRAVGLFESLKK